MLGVLGVSTGIGRACLWDRDTLREEVLVRPTIWDLLLGQFPHHGDVYYQTRISRLQKAGQLEVLDLNDLAVAHVRLKEFEQAWKALNQAHKISPDHYETLSNMGVTAKKQGDFEKGAGFIQERWQSSRKVTWAWGIGISRPCIGERSLRMPQKRIHP